MFFSPLAKRSISSLMNPAKISALISVCTVMRLSESGGSVCGVRAAATVTSTKAITSNFLIEFKASTSRVSVRMSSSLPAGRLVKQRADPLTQCRLLFENALSLNSVPDESRRLASVAECAFDRIENDGSRDYDRDRNRDLCSGREVVSLDLHDIRIGHSRGGRRRRIGNDERSVPDLFYVAGQFCFVFEPDRDSRRITCTEFQKRRFDLLCVSRFFFGRRTGEGRLTTEYACKQAGNDRGRGSRHDSSEEKSGWVQASLEV